MIWLTGGALVLSLVMIGGLLGLIVWRGTGSFWPGRSQEITLVDGKKYLGEITRSEDYIPTEQELENLRRDLSTIAAAEIEKESGKKPDPADLKQIVDRRMQAPLDYLRQYDGKSLRRMIWTANFDIDKAQRFYWVPEYAQTSDTLPEWAMLIERLESGRFNGILTGFAIDGKQVADSPSTAWEAFQERFGEIKSRRRQIDALRKHDIGAINRRQERERIAAKKAELAYGPNSPEHERALREYESTKAELQQETAQVESQIAALETENKRYTLTLKVANGTEHTVKASEIVRAYFPNQLSVFGQLGVYLSRLREFVFDNPRDANQEGGVFPAIWGTVCMTMIMCVLVVPIGVLAALYLREYAKAGPVVSAIRVAINNLAGVPSIVFGVFGLGFFCYVIGARIDDLFNQAYKPNPVYGTGCLLWASFTLALMTLPVVIVSTEEALSAVPNSMREGSYACGASKWQTILRVVLPRAMPGIMTGMILAMARGAGEVAPLMLVGAKKLAPDLPLDTVAPFLHPERSFMHLGFHIYDLGFQSSDSEAVRPMVYTTTLLLIGIIVVLNITAIWLRSRLKKKFQFGAF